MNLAQNLALALRGLSANKMRTGLTMLGIIIGVGVVILVVAIGQGASKSVTDAINSLGTNLLSVRSSWRRIQLNAVSRAAPSTSSSTTGTSTGTASGASLLLSQNSNLNGLTLDDAHVIQTMFTSTVSAVDPEVRGSIQVRFNSENASTSLIGATISYPYVNNASVDKGRWFTNYEDQGNDKVCIVGQTVALNLTGNPDADLTGQTISVNRIDFKIIGMLASKGFGSFGQDQDDVVIMPLKTAMQRVVNKTRLDSMNIRCVSPQAMPLAQQQIIVLLRARHHLRPPFPDNDAFQVNSQTELMQRQQTVTSTMTALLTAVAIISLVVGGIGIMNIMLVSVTERTREIGIRKAIGATPSDIMMQFLIEATIMSLIGGLIGMVFGIGGSLLLAKLGWNTIISYASLFVALAVSAGVGIFFGIYPANKASNLHPIEALRYE